MGWYLSVMSQSVVMAIAMIHVRLLEVLLLVLCELVSRDDSFFKTLDLV
jgi:hypothetical protein